MITKKEIAKLRTKCEEGVFPLEKVPELLDEVERLKAQLNESIRCSFCGKSAREVRKLIAGPDAAIVNVYICDECIELSVELVAAKGQVEENEAP